MYFHFIVDSEEEDILFECSFIFWYGVLLLYTMHAVFSHVENHKHEMQLIISTRTKHGAIDLQEEGEKGMIENFKKESSCIKNKIFES